jgi:heme/copper-type cytochrome/quinol oxidase subunit 3
VVCGLGVLGWLLAGALRNTYSVRHHAPVRMAAMFWHFVDVVWVLMFLTVFLL